MFFNVSLNVSGSPLQSRHGWLFIPASENVIFTLDQDEKQHLQSETINHSKYRKYLSEFYPSLNSVFISGQQQCGQNHLEPIRCNIIQTQQFTKLHAEIRHRQ